jgi:hypothetical protein
MVIILIHLYLATTAFAWSEPDSPEALMENPPLQLLPRAVSAPPLLAHFTSGAAQIFDDFIMAGRLADHEEASSTSTAGALQKNCSEFGDIVSKSDRMGYERMGKHRAASLNSRFPDSRTGF